MAKAKAPHEKYDVHVPYNHPINRTCALIRCAEANLEGHRNLEGIQQIYDRLTDLRTELGQMSGGKEWYLTQGGDTDGSKTGEQGGVGVE